MKKSLKIIFFGSGPVAAKSLVALYDTFDVIQVVTKARKGNHPAPVEDVAVSKGSSILYADTRDEVTALVTTGKLTNCRLGVIVDYGVILDVPVMNHFELGIINSHFSLLPLLRGADPITFSILEGHPVTGVSLMRIVEKLDEGDILSQEKLMIKPIDTTPLLTDKLIGLSNKMLIKTLPKYNDGTLSPYPQGSSPEPTYTRKLVKEDGRIDWKKSAETIAREIRAYADWPTSYFEKDGFRYVVNSAEISQEKISIRPGTMVASKNTLGIQTSKGVVWITHITPAGKKEMPISAFLNGYRIRFETSSVG